jgi:hypothetical protein
MDSIPPRVSNLLRGAPLNAIWLLHSIFLNGLGHSLFQNLFGGPPWTEQMLWPPRFQNRADSLRTSEQNLNICQRCRRSSSRLDRYQPSEQQNGINALFCQGVCSHSVYQSDAMDQLGCCSTLYYVRKRGTWGCTSLFVSYLRIFCFHPKTRKFAFIRKQESLVLGGGANFWSWIGKLAIEICQIRQKRDKLSLSCSPLTYSFTRTNKSIHVRTPKYSVATVLY